MPVRVVLTEDHTLVRAGIRALLQAIPDVEVVAEAGDGHDAVRLAQTTEPDLMLLDIALPGLNGLEVATRVTRQFPNVRVLMLSMHKNEEYVWQALRAGAAGYLLKDAGIAELEIAIRAVAKGETYLSPGVSKHVVADYIRRVGGETSHIDRLTTRQREILQLIAEGNTTHQIAHTLNLSVKTVESHRMQLMERLQIHDIAGLVRYAMRVGLVPDNQ